MERFGIAPEKTEQPDQSYLKMYEVSGQDPITEHSLARYKKDKEQDEAIETASNEYNSDLLKRDLLDLPDDKRYDFILKGLDNPDIKIQANYTSMIRFLSFVQRTKLIERQLKNPNVEVQIWAARIIDSAPSAERKTLIEIGLQSPFLKVRITAANKIFGTAYSDSIALIQHALKSEEIEVQHAASWNIQLCSEVDKIFFEHQVLEIIKKNQLSSKVNDQILATEMIRHAPRDQRDKLLSDSLDHPNQEIRRKASIILGSASNEALPNLVAKALIDSDKKVSLEAASLIIAVSKERRNALIELGLQSNDPETVYEISRAMADLPENEKESFQKLITTMIQVGLKSNDIEKEKNAITLIVRIPKPERAKFLKKALESSHIETQIAAMHEVWILNRHDIKEAIKHGLENPNFEIQIAAASQIHHARGEDIFNLIYQALENSNIEVQKTAASHIGYADREKQAELFDIIKQKGLGEELIKPPLYQGVDIDKDSLSRKSFAKSGSETTLLGGSLLNKAIIRHIQPFAFLSWQKLYENYDIWQEHGFDYVPIEPIISYRLNKEGLVDVTSGVLDISLAGWINKTNLFYRELANQKSKIKSVLRELKIGHGHDHDGNFCLRFFRDKEGKVDFSKTPRLYMIDFDQAVSPKK